MIYFDTSYIIKCYLNEAGSTQVRPLAESADGMACCMHGRMEFWTAVKRNVREGLLTSAEAVTTFRRFSEDETNGVWHWFPVEMSWVESACEHVAAAPDTMFLRAADALHLACAAAKGFAEVFPHDRHMMAAAHIFGIQGRDVIGT